MWQEWVAVTFLSRFCIANLQEEEGYILDKDICKSLVVDFSIIHVGWEELMEDHVT